MWWEIIGSIVGLIVMLFLFALLPHIVELPDSIAKYFGSKLRAGEIEKRLLALETQMYELKAAGGPVGVVPTKAPPDPAVWNVRLEAAAEISETGYRDEVFGKLAQDAALVGEAGFVRLAVDRISKPADRDETISACAIRLARTGKRAEALELARTMSNASERDETLSTLATV